GIPRVELAYAQHFIADLPEQLQFVARDALGRLRVVDTGLAADFVSDIAQFWRDDISSRRACLRVAWRALYIHARLLLGSGRSLARCIDRHPGRSAYIVVSHLHLERADAIERLKSAGKLSLIYFVHDLIPIMFPEYCPGRETAVTRRRMQAAATVADVAIVNS